MYFLALSYLIDRISEIILIATKVIKNFSVCVPFLNIVYSTRFWAEVPFFSPLHPYSNPNESNLKTTRRAALQLKPT